MTCPHHVSDLESESLIHNNLIDSMSYSDYLNLDKILSSQIPKSDQHDEMLFIIIHQASELWLKLISHELIAANNEINENRLRNAFKIFSRIKEIISLLNQSWNVLSTLTPVDYINFRDLLGRSSGFQSYSYRKVEFLLGNKNASMLEVHKNNKRLHCELEGILMKPSLYDTVIFYLHSSGLKIDPKVLQRDFSLAYKSNFSVLNAWLEVYKKPDDYFEIYELAEKLVDLENLIQEWRFKHVSTVKRIIGTKSGTGGSSGVSFLNKIMEVRLFPELYEVRGML